MPDPLGVAGAVIAAIGAVAAAAYGIVRIARELGDARRTRSDATRSTFLEVRTRLIRDRRRLETIARQLVSEDVVTIEGTSMLARSEWLFRPPRLLDEVRLRLVTSPRPATEGFGRLWPKDQAGKQLTTYVEAMSLLPPDERPRLWDHPSYRLLGIDVLADRVDLTFSMATYFDHINYGEGLAYELARASLRQERPHRRALRARQAVGSILDFDRRYVLCGVDAVTLRTDGDNTTFFMHYRDPQKVAAAMGTFHVTPAGEFQPALDDPTTFRTDLDLWKTIMREYDEEWLRTPSADGKGGRQPDYAAPPYAEMLVARAAGEIRPYLLGLAIDPLTLKCDALVACVWDANTFDSILGEFDVEDDEGMKRVGLGNGVPFDDSSVRPYIDDARTLGAGAATLSLALEARAWLIAEVKP